MADVHGKSTDTKADVDGDGKIFAQWKRVTFELDRIADILGGGSSGITYQSAVVNLAAATDNQELVAAPASGFQIKVYGLHISSAGAGSIELQDEDNTLLTGIIPVGANGGFIWQIAPAAAPWITVADNKALDAKTVGGSATMDGVIVFAVVPV